MKKSTSNRGFTLVEMMVVVALLSIVSVLLYQMWHYLYTSHQRTEMLYIQQNAANQVAEWIEANTSTATRVEITYREDYSKDPKYSYIYSSDPDNYENSKIMFYNSETGLTSTITDVPLNLEFYTIGLNPALPDSDSKAMKFTISAQQWQPNGGFSDTQQSYSTSSIVSFPNMARAMLAKKSDYVDSSGNDGHYEDADGNDLGLFASNANHTVAGHAIKFRTGTSVDPTLNIQTGTGDHCFIATAAYGSKNDVTVATLRMFRDEILLSNPVGSAFVDFYYRVSPPIADAIAQSPTARLVVRTALTPLVLIATLMLQPMWLVVTFVTLIYLYIVKFFILPKKSLHLR